MSCAVFSGLCPPEYLVWIGLIVVVVGAKSGPCAVVCLLHTVHDDLGVGPVHSKSSARDALVVIVIAVSLVVRLGVLLGGGELLVS